MMTNSIDGVNALEGLMIGGAVRDTARGGSRPITNEATRPGARATDRQNGPKLMQDHRERDLDVKRTLDVVIASTLLVLMSPVLVAIWVAVRLKMGRPVLFTQTRPGRDAVPFRIIKFRTMLPPGPGEPWQLTDESRTTGLGRFLRDYSLDELPELINVLRGEMSLVGPRPLLTEYLDVYTPRQARRHEMRPGITGWAQVRGRRNLRLSERLDLDIWYVDHWSLWLDARILAATIWTIFSEPGDVPGQTLTDVDDIGLWRGGPRPGDGAAGR